MIQKFKYFFVTKPGNFKSKNLENHIITTNKIDKKFINKLKKIDF